MHQFVTRFHQQSITKWLKLVRRKCINMIFKNRLIFAFLMLTTIEYRKVFTGAIGILNVRKTHKLQTRSLLFPPTAPTRVQFIGGIGIPVEDLRFESVTSGYVLKAEYFLPEKADIFHQKIKPVTIHRRRKSVNETYLYDRSSEQVPLLNENENKLFNNQTLNFTYHKRKFEHKKNHTEQQSHDHLKRQIKPGAFYRWILYKAIETILNKSALNGHICMLRSICEHAALPLNYEGGLLAEILHIILTPSSSRDEISRQEHKNYLRAEILGRSGEDCAEAFRMCTKSPMSIISTVFET